VGEVCRWGIFHPLASHRLSHSPASGGQGGAFAKGASNTGQCKAFAENMGIDSER